MSLDDHDLAPSRPDQPGHSNLADAAQLRLVNLVRCGDGLVVQAVGTFPAATGAAGAGGVTRVEISVCPPIPVQAGRDAARRAERELAELARRLQEWCDDGTPLRLLGATGSALTLVSPDGAVVPLPRSA